MNKLAMVSVLVPLVVGLVLSMITFILAAADNMFGSRMLDRFYDMIMKGMKLMFFWVVILFHGAIGYFFYTMWKTVS